MPPPPTTPAPPRCGTPAAWAARTARAALACAGVLAAAGAAAQPAGAPRCAALPRPPADLAAATTPWRLVLACGAPRAPTALLLVAVQHSGRPGQADEGQRLLAERHDRTPAGWQPTRRLQDGTGPLASVDLLQAEGADSDGDGRWEFYLHYRLARDGLDADTRKLLVLDGAAKAALRGREPKDDDAPPPQADAAFDALAAPVQQHARRLWQRGRP